MLRSMCLMLSAMVLASAAAGAAPGNAEKGKALYDEDCATCHGKTGAGDGKLGRNLQHKPTAFTDKSKLGDDGKLVKAIRDGSKAVGLSAEMDGFINYSDQDASDVVAYLKTLAKK